MSLLKRRRFPIEIILSLITGVRDCKVVLVGDRYYIVEGSSRRVVTVIKR